MAAYLVDDSAISELLGSLPPWAKPLVLAKISEIRELENPRAAGGTYRGHWVYPIGKLHMFTEINDENRIVKIMRIVRLP